MSHPEERVILEERDRAEEWHDAERVKWERFREVDDPRITELRGRVRRMEYVLYELAQKPHTGKDLCWRCRALGALGRLPETCEKEET